jgi:hypothetical protein
MKANSNKYLNKILKNLTDRKFDPLITNHPLILIKMPKFMDHILKE